MSILTKDRALALSVLVLVAVMFIESGEIAPRASWQPYGSAFYPRILLAVVAVLSVLVLLRTFLPGAEKQGPVLPQAVDFLRRNPRIIGLFALFALFAAMLPVVGYILASIGFLLLSFVLLMGRMGRKRAVMGVAVAVGSTLLVHVIFHYALGIRLP